MTNTNTLAEQVTAQVLAALAPAIAAAVEAAVANVAVQPEAGSAPAVTAPAAESYRVRTDRQKDASHRKIAEVNTRWDMKLVGGTRKVSDLSATERVQYDAEVKACWTKPAGKTVTR